MSKEIPTDTQLAPVIGFWFRIWQQQLEQSFRLWGFWARYLPHESAAQLAAEAEALKPVVRTTRAKPAPQPAAPKPEANPVLAVVPAAPALKTMPSKKAPRTPVAAKSKAATAATAKPIVH